MCADNSVHMKQLKLNKEHVNNKEQIQQLRNELSRKLLQISDLGAKIAEKDEYIQSFGPSLVNSFRTIVKIRELKEQEVTEYNKAIDATIINFRKAWAEVILLKKDVKGSFDLFQHDINGLVEDFERAKFWIIRVSNEYRILKILIKEYEELQQELLGIEQKIEDLQK